MKKLADVTSEFGVYVMAVLGVLSSRYLPAMITQGGDLSRVVLSIPSIGEITSACFIAIVVTVIVDRGGDKAGKMKRIKRRLLNSFAYGMMWFQLVQMFFNN